MELSGFCLKFGFDLLLLMTISFTECKEPIRELAVFSHSTTCREEVLTAALLEDCTTLTAGPVLSTGRVE